MASQAMQLEKRPPTGEGNSSRVRGTALWLRLQSAWAAMPGEQRRRWIIGFGALAVLLSGFSWWGLRTDWRTLYSGLDAEDARQVGLTLAQAQIPFELSEDGLALRVPSSQLDKARLATSGKALKSGRMGFELFDKPNWMGSEFDEQVNYQRALEGELEHTVSSLSDVEVARVHLVMPHESLFREQQRPAKASVVLKLRRSSLGEGEADSIRNLVASAVDGLSPDHVMLVDASGRLSLGPRTAEGLRLGAEQALEGKLVSTLEAVTGPGNVRASVTIDYASESLEETKETYDPTQSATLSMERTEQTSGGASVPAGVPGTASNAPNAQSLPVFPKQMSAAQSSKTESGTYGVSKTLRHMVEGPGNIRKITVAVLVNDRMIAGATKVHPAQWQPRSADELRNLTALAQAAVGFDSARGDLVSVQNMSFEDNLTSSSQSMSQRVYSTIRTFPEVVKYLFLTFALLILVFFGIRPALKQALALVNTAGEREQAALQDGNQAPQQVAETVLYDPSRARAQEMFDRVTKEIKNEPAQSSRLLQSWIRSE
jgi:flagellar M-ring protein FliF